MYAHTVRFDEKTKKGEQMAKIKTVEFNSDLVGFVLTMDSGRVANVQFEVEINRLDGNCGEPYLQRYTEYDDDLTEAEDALASDWTEENEHRFGHLVAISDGIIVAI